MTALQDLLARVEAGEATTMRFEDCGFDGWAELAYFGSLDAARELHEAVLPEWEWRLSASNAVVHPITATPYDQKFYGMADNPARAWLIAILKALIAQEAGE